MKTLIITNSYDGTTDVVVHYLGSEKIFRLNFDLWESYEFVFDARGLTLECEGQRISHNEVAKLYWRKPFVVTPAADADSDEYLSAELRYIFREIFTFFQKRGIAVLVDPNADRRVGKLTQLNIAKRFFHVPQWCVLWNATTRDLNGPTVVKSLTSTRRSSKIFYTTAVDLEDLDMRLPWFTQQLINASDDVTVVYVNQDVFAFRRPRVAGESLDWRQDPAAHKPEAWSKFSLPVAAITGIREFMRVLNLAFARLDFLLSEGELVFLEVNTNGQWAWLDIENTNGLMARMLRELDPISVEHSPVLEILG